MNRFNFYLVCTGAVIFSSLVFATHNSPEALESRVNAVGEINVEGMNVEGNVAPTATAPAVAQSASAATAPAVAQSAPAVTAPDGKSVYGKACFACHTSGVAGAPKLGDAAVWADRIAQGVKILNDHAVNGYQGTIGYMPAKGGNPSLSDAEVVAAVQYMIDQVQ